METSKNSRIKKMSTLILVTDLNYSVEFYTRKLGFDLDFRYEDFYAAIFKDNYSIHLKLGDERPSVKNNEPELIFSVEGIKYLYQELLNENVKVVQALREMPYGKEFYILDPDKNIIAFVEEA
jgi:predicted enzyme related to lactoylglutathione lyase